MKPLFLSNPISFGVFQQWKKTGKGHAKDIFNSQNGGKKCFIWWWLSLTLFWSWYENNIRLDFKMDIIVQHNTWGPIIDLFLQIQTFIKTWRKFSVKTLLHNDYINPNENNLLIGVNLPKALIGYFLQGNVQLRHLLKDTKPSSVYVITVICLHFNELA